MQAAAQKIPPPGVVFDSDLGSIDDLLALALLYGASTRRGAEVRLASVSISRPDLQAAAFAEALFGFYSEISNREIPQRFRRRRSLPVGLIDAPAVAAPRWIAEPLARKDDQDGPLYPQQIRKLNDTAEVSALVRNALTAYHDQNCRVALTGPATNLVRVMDVGGAKQWIEAKAQFLSVAMGSFENGDPDPHAAADVAAARRLFGEWPTPIVAVGREIGDAVRFPASALAKQFRWTGKHPVLDAYRAAGEMPYDASAWALATALYAVRPNEGYFRKSEPGEISIDSDGRARFTPGGHRRHRYLVFDPGQAPCLEDAYVELVSAEPAPRQLPDFLKRLIEEEKKKEAEKKATETKQGSSQ